MSLQVVILAGGKGKRMLSQKPKVLHPIAGRPMLERIVDKAQSLNPDNIHVIIGNGGNEVKQALPNLSVNWVTQHEQLGTGHALMQAMPSIPESSQVLVLSGDVPLIQTDTLEKLVNTISQFDPTKPCLSLLVAKLKDPSGLGRIIRDPNDNICAIVEEKDASEEQKKINEIYSGICCARATDLQRWLPELSNDNAQGEYYLTEIIDLASKEKTHIKSSTVIDPKEIQGVNSRQQLHDLERLWQESSARKLLNTGVSLADMNRIDIRGELTCEHDVWIDVNCLFIGNVSIGKGCVIEPNCILKDVKIGDNTLIHANSVLENCEVDENCQIGPFARLRPGTKLESDCKVGNFVETKNAYFQNGTKASHLSYLGDVTLGKNVNIGAGTITCNYDGVNKHQTVIEDNVFIGSDTQLVAPVKIGANATIGAGSTIRKNAPPNELTLTYSQQKTIHGWKGPKERS